MSTIAINGLGRIGWAAFKILLETPQLGLERYVPDDQEAVRIAKALGATVIRHLIGAVEGFLQWHLI